MSEGGREGREEGRGAEGGRGGRKGRGRREGGSEPERRRIANYFFPNDIAVAPPTMSIIRIRACVTARSCIRRSQAPCAYKKLQISIIIN